MQTAATLVGSTRAAQVVAQRLNTTKTAVEESVHRWSRRARATSSRSGPCRTRRASPRGWPTSSPWRRSRSARRRWRVRWRSRSAGSSSASERRARGRSPQRPPSSRSASARSRPCATAATRRSRSPSPRRSRRTRSARPTGSPCSCRRWRASSSAPRLAVASELTERRVRDEDELDAIYPLPILTRVPVLSRREIRRSSGGRVPAVSEAFRTLQAQLEVRGETRRTIMLTSPSSNDGKTTSVLNLAINLVESGSRVICHRLRPAQAGDRRAARHRDDQRPRRHALAQHDARRPPDRGPPRAPASRSCPPRAPAATRRSLDALIRKLPVVLEQALETRRLRDHRHAAARRGERRAEDRSPGRRHPDRRATRATRTASTSSMSAISSRPRASSPPAWS